MKAIRYFNDTQLNPRKCGKESRFFGPAFNFAMDKTEPESSDLGVF